MSTLSLPATPFLGRLDRVLDDLGTDPDQIADIFWVADAHGRRAHPTENPVARYLRVRLHADAVRVGPSAARVVVTAGGESVSIPLPVAVREFLGRFDQGLYPELDHG